MGKQTEQNKADSDHSMKVAVPGDLASGLVSLMNKVNDGYLGGKVNRQDLVSWIIARFLRTFTETDVQSIRDAHYDDEAMFDTMYRLMKETGDVPDFLKEAMRKHFKNGIESRKSKKPLTPESIIDGLSVTKEFP